MTSPPVIVQVLLALLETALALFDFSPAPRTELARAVRAGAGDRLNFFTETSGLMDVSGVLGLAFLIYFPLYLLRRDGEAGDVKLMAAVGAISGAATGWNSGPYIVIWRHSGNHTDRVEGPGSQDS